MSNLFTGPLKDRQEGEGVLLVFEADNVIGLERFRMIIQRDRIRAAAGAVLRKASNADGIRVFLNKQVAFAKHVSFCEPEGESPMGPIKLMIQADDPSKVINWVTGGQTEPLRRRQNTRSTKSQELDTATL
jgi:predicted RNA binding protein with dsRBD fold (UPF0201 family)